MLLRAREIVQRQGTLPMIWRTQVALGNLYAATGRSADAQPEYLAARQTVEALAAGLPDPALRDELLKRALALLPRSYRPATRMSVTAARPGGLTSREHDVATMIATGGPTARSPKRWCSASVPSRRTSATSWASLA